MDTADWLRGPGLGQYAPAFADNDIGPDVLPSLTAEDLRDIGVASVGHRRRLLEAIAALQAERGMGAVVPSPSEPPAAPRSEPERRQLTVLFCDLVGSTALSARLDPEDLRELIGAYHARVAEAVHRFDGFVAKYMGDGVLAYFGWPEAHEDDAERAVRAGLAAIEAVSALTPALSRSAGEGEGLAPFPLVGEGWGEGSLRVRIGIATGLVVVGELIGEGEARERGVVGETPNLAARLQALAAPDMVVIAPGTRRLLGNRFDLRPLGRHALKGISEPVEAWAVEGISAAESRFESVHGGALSGFIGREHELGLLMDRWGLAQDGAGQVVLLSGEPGIGKSRILSELRARFESGGVRSVRFTARPIT